MDTQINEKPILEEMSNFFDKRVDEYEEHMFNYVSGVHEYYIETAKYIPKEKDVKILDLGCGTGLELDEIFKINPNVHFTGIDLSKKMLEKLMEKYSDKKEQINLINASYFDVDYGETTYDRVVSVMTLHHFTHEEKLKLYKKIYKSLAQHGQYIETDYTAQNQEEENFYYSEIKRIKAETKITEGFYHYDTPCTIDNIINLMHKAGFIEVELKWKCEGTAIIVAEK